MKISDLSATDHQQVIFLINKEFIAFNFHFYGHFDENRSPIFTICSQSIRLEKAFVLKSEREVLWSQRPTMLPAEGN